MDGFQTDRQPKTNRKESGAPRIHRAAPLLLLCISFSARSHGRCGMLTSHRDRLCRVSEIVTKRILQELVFTRNICGFSSIILLQARQKYAGGLSPGKYFSRRMQQNLPKRHLYTLVKTGSKTHTAHDTTSQIKRQQKTSARFSWAEVFLVEMCSKRTHGVGLVCSRQVIYQMYQELQQIGRAHV